MSAVARASLAREEPWVPFSSVSEPMDLATRTPGVLPGGFTVGSYVLVDPQYNCGEKDSEGGLGYINGVEGDGVVSVYFSVGTYTETGVLLERLHHAVGATPKRKAAPTAGAFTPQAKQLKHLQPVCPAVDKLMKQAQEGGKSLEELHNMYHTDDIFKAKRK